MTGNRRTDPSDLRQITWRISLGAAVAWALGGHGVSHMGTAYKLFIFTASMPAEAVLQQQKEINDLLKQGALLSKYEHGEVISLVELKVSTYEKS